MLGKNIFEKILEAHGISPAPSPGESVELPIDQTLTQDATGTMACLQFEALEVHVVNGIANIEFSIPSVSHVSVKVFNISGQLVETLLDEKKSKGEEN